MINKEGNTIILDFIQTKVMAGWRYEFQHEGNILYTVEVPINIGRQKAFILENNNIIFTLEFDVEQSVKTVMNSAVSIVPYKIYNAKEQSIGRIEGFKSKSFGGYIYHKMNLWKTCYTGYMVGMGRQGTFFPLYLDNKIVAQGHKPVTVYENKDIYKVTIADSSNAILPTCIFMLYMDLAYFARSGEIATKKKKAEYFYSMNKELKSKYVVNFGE